MKMTELKTPFYIKMENGCEVFTNSRDMKIILNRTISFLNNIRSETYAATYYVREGKDYVITNTVKAFLSEEEFIRDISCSEDFTNAINEYSK